MSMCFNSCYYHCQMIEWQQLIGKLYGIHVYTETNSKVLLNRIGTNVLRSDGKKVMNGWLTEWRLIDGKRINSWRQFCTNRCDDYEHGQKHQKWYSKHLKGGKKLGKE